MEALFGPLDPEAKAKRVEKIRKERDAYMERERSKWEDPKHREDRKDKVRQILTFSCSFIDSSNILSHRHMIPLLADRLNRVG